MGNQLGFCLREDYAQRDSRHHGGGSDKTQSMFYVSDPQSCSYPPNP